MDEQRTENCQSYKSAPELTLKSHSEESPTIVDMKEQSIDSQNFTFTIFKNRKISICKPLIPLKLILFIFYGAGSFMMSFMIVLFKKRGVSLSELSAMTMIAPFFQFLVTALSGVIADKIGKAKLVFAINVLITTSSVLTIILLPSTKTESIEVQNVDLVCNKTRSGDVRILTSCYETNVSMELKSCRAYCPEEFTEKCSMRNMDCRIFNNSKEFNSSLVIDDTPLEKINDSCQYSLTPFETENSTHYWCSESQNVYCSVSCMVHSKMKQSVNGMVIVYGCLYVVYLATFSTSYRCLDVTCMFLVKEYDSSFGHERFFAMLGFVVISPLAGFIVDKTSPPGGERNYASALYLFIIICAVMAPILYYLPMRARPPAENMWKKSIILLKNPDTVAFFIIIIALGTAWNFGKSFLFWYLEEMNASSMLIGLVTSVGALYGLPFLLTSQWWVKKIGATQIFILALLGHTVHFMGYAFLIDPWISLGIEATGVLTYFLLWVAVVEYSNDIAPEGLTATVIAIAGALHFSIGKVSSGLIGRFVMKHFGGKIAFKFSAALTLSAAFLYCVFLCIRKIYTKADGQVPHTERSSNGEITDSKEIASQFVPTEAEISGCYKNSSFIDCSAEKSSNGAITYPKEIGSQVVPTEKEVSSCYTNTSFIVETQEE